MMMITALLQQPRDQTSNQLVFVEKLISFPSFVNKSLTGMVIFINFLCFVVLGSFSLTENNLLNH